MKSRIVVGGSRGSGRVVAIRLADAGYHVKVVSRTPGQELGTHAGSIEHNAADLHKPADVHRTADLLKREWSAADGLVFCQRSRGDNVDWDAEMQVSVEATRILVEAFAAARGDQGGSIVIVTSVASRQIAPEQPIQYNVAKAALAQMMRYYAAQLGPRGIRVNAVAPASVLKPETSRFYLDDPEKMEMYERAIPLRRIPTSEDVAALIEFLLSPSSQMITGQEIVIDGGLSLATHESLARAMWSSRT